MNRDFGGFWRVAVLSGWGAVELTEVMMRIGYARVSTIDQNLAVQQEKLERAGCEKVLAEKASGGTVDGRAALLRAVNFLRRGDVLVVTRIDRLARSIGDLQALLKVIGDAGADLQCVDQPIDTSSAAGKCFLDMLGVFAEFERNIIRERQCEGIARAKRNGVYKGGVRTIDRREVMRYHDQGISGERIADLMGVAKSSIYRILGEVRANGGNL